MTKINELKNKVILSIEIYFKRERGRERIIPAFFIGDGCQETCLAFKTGFDKKQLLGKFHNLPRKAIAGVHFWVRLSEALQEKQRVKK